MALVNLDRPLQVLGASAVSGGGGVTSLQDLSNMFGNFLYVDEETDLALVSGEREIPAGYTIELVDNAITGLAPLFTAPLRIQADSNAVIQAPLTLNAIVYVGAGAFVRGDAVGLYVQNNIVFVTPSGTLYSLAGSKNVNNAFFCDNFAYLGGGPGQVSDFNQATVDTCNLLDWATGLLVRDCVNNLFTQYISPGTPTGAGPSLRFEGDKTSRISVIQGDARVLSGQSYLDISPSVADGAVLVVKDGLYSKGLGGDFFTVGSQGSISAYANNSSSGTTDSYADNGSGGTTVFSTQTSPGDGRKLTIASSTNFDGTHVIFNDVPGVSFDIPVAYAAGGTVGTWVFESVIVTTSAAHGLSNGDAVQIDKSTNYNFGRVIFNASGSVFSIDDVPSNGDDAAGQWDSGSLKQNAPGMVCEGNGDQPDTSQLLALDVTTLETLTGTATGTGALITSWGVNVDNQYTLNPPGQVIGTVRYDGRDIRAGVTLSCAYAASAGNPGAPISFRLFRDSGGGFVQVNSDIPGVLTNQEKSVTWTLETPLTKGDLLQGKVYDAAGNIINIVSASLLIKADGQGI